MVTLCTGKPCSECAVGEADRHTWLSGRRFLKITFATWPEKRLAHETVRLQTSMIAVLLEGTGILEKRGSLSKRALATIGATPGESPMQSQCPYQVLQRYNRGGSTIIGQTFLGSWALNRRAFRKAWDMQYGGERSGQGTPPAYDFCWVFLRLCPSSCNERLVVIWPMRAVCSPTDQKMSKMPGRFIEQQKLAITYRLTTCPSRTPLSLGVFFHLCHDPSSCCPFGGVNGGAWCTWSSITGVLEGRMRSMCWSAGALPAVRMDFGWLMVQAKCYFGTWFFTQLNLEELCISVTIFPHWIQLELVNRFQSYPFHANSQTACSVSSKTKTLFLFEGNLKHSYSMGTEKALIYLINIVHGCFLPACLGTSVPLITRQHRWQWSVLSLLVLHLFVAGSIPLFLTFN